MSKSIPAGPRDFPEHFADDDNGCYSHRCEYCGQEFLAHKGYYGPCKLCAVKHFCHAPGCKTAVSPKLWGCLKHWKMLPRENQKAIWRHYRPGQENDKRPTKEYMQAAMDAKIAIAEIEGNTQAAEQLRASRRQFV